MSRHYPVLGRLRGLFGQEVARTNAAQASVRLKHQSRQRRDLDAFLSQQPNPPVRGERGPRGTASGSSTPRGSRGRIANPRGV